MSSSKVSNDPRSWYRLGNYDLLTANLLLDTARISIEGRDNAYYAVICHNAFSSAEKYLNGAIKSLVVSSLGDKFFKVGQKVSLVFTFNSLLSLVEDFGLDLKDEKNVIFDACAYLDKFSIVGYYPVDGLSTNYSNARKAIDLAEIIKNFCISLSGR